MAKSKKWTHLKDLAGHCRILSLLTLIFFGLTSFVLIIACSVALGSGSGKYHLSTLFSGDHTAEEKDHAVTLLVLTILAIIATGVSLLLLLATFSDNMWLTIPYWLLLLVLMALCIFQLLHFGLCIGRCEEVPSLTESAFARNILHGGGVYIFSSMAFLGFLVYVFLPSFGYFLECRTKRAERLAEQKKAEPLPVPPPVPPRLAPHPILPPPSVVPEPPPVFAE